MCLKMSLFHCSFWRLFSLVMEFHVDGLLSSPQHLKGVTLLCTILHHLQWEICYTYLCSSVIAMVSLFSLILRYSHITGFEQLDYDRSQYIVHGASPMWMFVIFIKFGNLNKSLVFTGTQSYLLRQQKPIKTPFQFP